MAGSRKGKSCPSDKVSLTEYTKLGHHPLVYHRTRRFSMIVNPKVLTRYTLLFDPTNGQEGRHLTFPFFLFIVVFRCRLFSGLLWVLLSSITSLPEWRHHPSTDSCLIPPRQSLLPRRYPVFVWRGSSGSRPFIHRTYSSKRRVRRGRSRGKGRWRRRGCGGGGVCRLVGTVGHRRVNVNNRTSLVLPQRLGRGPVLLTVC